MKRILLNTALLGLLGVSHAALAATQAQIDQAWNKGLAWLFMNQHGDGGWSSAIASGNAMQQGLGIQTTGAALDALSAMNFKTNYTYSAGIAWLANTEAASVDALARQAVAMKNAGEDAVAHGTRLASWRNERLAWGAYPGYEAGLPDTAMGVAALIDVQGTSYNNTNILNALCQILPAQSPAPSNLWSYSVTAVATAPASQTSGAVMPTVHAVLALGKANTRFTSGTCSNGVVYTFINNINAAMTGLLAKKNADNGYGDHGTSGVLETALMLRAFKAVAPTDPNAVTAIDYLIAQQALDGSWRGDALQTAEVLLALAASTTATTQRPSAAVITDTDKDGVPDPVETLLGMNSTVADSRLLADGAGSTVTPPVQLRMAASLSTASTPSKTSARTVKKAAADKVVDVVIAGSAVQTSTATATVSPRDWDKTPDVEIFLAGSSMQSPAIETAVASLFAPGGMEVFAPEDGANAGMYRGYYGTVIAGDNASLWGKSLLIHVSAAAGSYGGAVSVAQAGGVPRMVVDRSCTAAGADPQWRCPARTVIAVPDAGLSDVEPLLHAGANLPPGAPPLTADAAARLDAARVNAMVSGVAVSKSLKEAGLREVSTADLANIFSKGTISSWAEIDDGLPPQPIIVCRLMDGAQPASNTLILGTGCDVSAPAPSAASSSVNSHGDVLSSPGLLVVENATADALVTCLNMANTGASFTVAGRETRVAPGSFAVGMLSADHQPATADQFGYIALDGMSPTKLNAATGLYTQFTETWMQWRRVTVNDVVPPAGNTLAALQLLRRQLADPDVLRALPGTIALTGAEGMGVSRLGDSCRAPR